MHIFDFVFFSVMSKFAKRVNTAVDALSSNPPKEVDDNDFIDASRLVYDGVREIRRAVLMNRVSFFFLFSLVLASIQTLFALVQSIQIQI